MLLKIKRTKPTPTTQCGRLLIDGEYFCDTIENADKMIPLGFYPIRVTYSPKFDELLPLVDNVPSRTGIRIHPGNTWRDSTGCILVGETPPDPLDKGEIPRLLSSRKTFNALRERLLTAQHNREAIFLDIVDASPQKIKQNRIYDKATQRSI